MAAHKAATSKEDSLHDVTHEVELRALRDRVELGQHALLPLLFVVLVARCKQPSTCSQKIWLLLTRTEVVQPSSVC